MIDTTTLDTGSRTERAARRHHRLEGDSRPTGRRDAPKRVQDLRRSAEEALELVGELMRDVEEAVAWAESSLDRASFLAVQFSIPDHRGISIIGRTGSLYRRAEQLRKDIAQFRPLDALGTTDLSNAEPPPDERKWGKDPTTAFWRETEVRKLATAQGERTPAPLGTWARYQAQNPEDR